MNFLIADAHAQATTATANPVVSLLPMVLIFAIFYFMLIRPQQKRQKAHREMVAAIKVGDEVVSAGGICGSIVAVEDDFVDMEVAKGVVMKVQRSAIAQVLPKGSV